MEKGRKSDRGGKVGGRAGRRVGVMEGEDRENEGMERKEWWEKKGEKRDGSY